MNTGNFEVKYYGCKWIAGEQQPPAYSHSYNESWEETDFFCPNCASRRVWRDAGEGDYYAGPHYLCLACKHTFSFYSTPSDAANDEQHKQRIAAIEAFRQKKFLGSTQST